MNIDWPILLPALLAGLLVLATHVPLGAQVLERGIVFLDLAIAQIAGIGVIAASSRRVGRCKSRPSRQRFSAHWR
jgi:zinc/manganese transport system permease protein